MRNKGLDCCSRDIPGLLLDIASLLRAAGVSVSLDEVLDAWRGLNVTPPACWLDVLRVTLVKKYENLMPLARLLELQGGGAGGEDKKLDGSRGTVSGQGLKHASRQLPVEDVLAALLEGSDKALDFLTEFSLAQQGELREEFLDHLDGKVKEARLALNWKAVQHRLNLLEQAGKTEASVARQRLELVEKLIRQKLEIKLFRKFGPQALVPILRAYNLVEKNWSDLAARDIAVLRPYLKRLGQYLGGKYSWRYRAAPKGKIDLRRTVMEACRRGGVPWRLRYRRKREAKPELVVLCDVSGSVAPFSLFMLEMVYAMQHTFRQVRTFAFVDEIAEITLEVAALPAAEAMERVARFSRCSASGFSNYGRVFQLFLERYGDMVSSWTSLLILGDARNNWRRPEVETFARIARKARKVIWLNPQPRTLWNTQDSLIGLYAPFCHVVKECSNLKQLIEITREGI
ncbi:VWA domain containing CoxE-like protein [Neomoorella glycerini]|uniref:VWA domain containing CoxE-like protein n=1 Tax=Neomoorella glycerini TaxID=55779 RepID=A0A6I5ZLK5_9FIRM|nr:VWA domain-containing protein [Moorella glycerini]QGP90752.1 VWA domain containing CoxE-like protein [Moorella glycerini]